MKLSLVDPIGSKEATDVDAVSSRNKDDDVFATPVAAKLKQEDLREGPEQKAKRTILLFEDYQNKAKARKRVKEALIKCECYKEKCLKIYSDEYDGMTSVEAKGFRLNTQS